jgi:hypothetical protein
VFVPQKDMVYIQSLVLDLSSRLLSAQRNIHILHDRLTNSEATIQTYQRMT